MYLVKKITFDSFEKAKQTKMVFKTKRYHYINTRTNEEYSCLAHPYSKNTSLINMYLYGKIYANPKEAALFSEHKALEREYGLKLRYKRSNRQLAKPWEEVPSSYKDKKKCWKDNSKRRKQYYKGV